MLLQQVARNSTSGGFVPFIGVSLVRDSQLLALRSYYSIDFPVKHFIVVAAKSVLSTNRLLAYELRHFQQFAANLVLITCDVAPSCAEGWNAVFQAFPTSEWGVYTARDTAWEPGSLAKLSAHMWEASRSGSVDVGLMHWSNMPLNSGGEFNAFAMTRTAISRFGLFDENLWPANFEDRDMELRLARMQPPLVVRTFDDVRLIHGNQREKAYKSGLWLADDPQDANEARLSKITGARFLVNANYIYRKWGCMGEAKQQFAPWSSCAFRTPFNRSDQPVWGWAASKAQRERDLALRVRRSGRRPGLFPADDSEAPVFYFPDNYAGWEGYVEPSGVCRLTGRLGAVGNSPSGGTICI